MTIIFQTKRLIAKAPAETDIDKLYLLQSDAKVMQFIGKGLPRTLEEVQISSSEIMAYYNKNGFSFFSIFEKQTGDFVGQGGLFQLNFDDSATEIEIGYRLNTKFWHKGLATELASALIQWGFAHLNLDKLVAVIKPENAASRKVLQKIGMHYLGKSEYAGFSVDKFEISNNKVDFAKLNLIPATLDDYPIMQNMGRFYVYDMSRYLGNEQGWEIPLDGLYECIDFKKYWQTDTAFPFFIKLGEELVGFVIVDKKGSDPNVDFNMAQFFILNKFKNKGIGKYIAHQCFKKFSGVWEVMVMPGNEGAYRFWRKIIADYTSTFEESTKKIAHLNDSLKNIFKFDSKAQSVG